MPKVSALCQTVLWLLTHAALPKASAGYPELLSGCASQLWLAPHQCSAPDKKSLLGGVNKTITLLMQQGQCQQLEPGPKHVHTGCHLWTSPPHAQGHGRP